MQSELLMVSAGILVASLLLMSSAAGGYWAGTRTVAPMIIAGPAIGPGWQGEQSELNSELAKCLEVSELAAGQSAALAALGRSSSVAVPVEIMKSIDRLVETTSQLTTRLVEIEASTRPPRSQRPATAGDATKPALIQEAAAKPQSTTAESNLTAEQMSDVMGGRKNLGDSTLGLESKRYPYDCPQHLAPWRNGESAPSLEQFCDVRCREISVFGISFFWPDRPDFERAVVSIGAGENVLFMHVQVCDSKAVYMHGVVSFLVECRYLGRMEELTARLHAEAELVGQS
jgi:hypothetical protein